MNKSNGIGLPMVLFLIFATLKLTGNIEWSWWWVASPIWIPVFLAAVVALAIVLLSVSMLLAGRKESDVRRMLGMDPKQENEKKDK